MHRKKLLVLVVIVFVCLFSTSFVGEQSKKKREGQGKLPTQQDPVGKMLRDLARAYTSYDAKLATSLFLPPDGSPDGKARAKHIQELEKDFKRNKGKQEKVAIAIRNTVVLVQTEVFLHERVERKPMRIPLEFKVAFTKDGCKIVSLVTRKK